MKIARHTGAGRREIALIAVLVLAATGLVSLLVAGPFGGRTSGSAAPLAGTDEANAQQAPARRIPGDPYAVGPTRAPVTLVMYADFGCVFCAKFSRETEPELVKRYVDTGVLRMEWRDYPMFGDESTAAARAGRAAAAQGRFWEFSRAVYAASPDRGHPELARDRLVAFAEQAAVPDMRRFQAELDGTTHDLAIQEDLNEGVKYGVPSTPAFVINGHAMVGAQPLEAFTAMIDKAAGGPR
ncbi:DsbA family protein [Amycolatopsis antarctica]|uniref:DsbA family protein n=1 Tax=Amycolatopsis antarctica TaxID=1854586 RepID=UPI001F0B0477|nr:thioredoxin domain-containing protein [Amycolatopsis antarctica]